MLEELTAEELREETNEEVVIAISQKSVVTRLELKTRELRATKSYHPDTLELNLYTPSELEILPGESFAKDPVHYYHKESRLLDKLKDTEVVPRITCVVPEQMKIVMEYLEGEQFHTKLMKIDRNYKDKVYKDDKYTQGGKYKDSWVFGFKKNGVRERLLRRLSALYDRTHDFSRSVVRGIEDLGNEERKHILREHGLELRSLNEEEVRLRSYLLKLVYGNSDEFQSQNPIFYNLDDIRGKQDRHRKWGAAKSSIKRYLRSKFNGTKLVDYNNFVNRFLNLYLRLVFDGPGKNGNNGKSRSPFQYNVKELLRKRKLRFIHGDFGPHNVIHAGNRTKVFDLNEARIGHPHVDVVLALFNLYSRPTESRVPNLIYNFWKDQRDVKEGYPDFQDFLVGCIATRMFQDIRIAASNGYYLEKERERFTDGHPDFDDLKKPQQEALFKYDRILDMEGAIPFYAVRDGFNTVLKGSPKREDLKEFLEMGRDFINFTYVSSPEVERYVGKPMRDMLEPRQDNDDGEEG